MNIQRSHQQSAVRVKSGGRAIALLLLIIGIFVYMEIYWVATLFMGLTGIVAASTAMEAWNVHCLKAMMDADRRDKSCNE